MIIKAMDNLSRIFGLDNKVKLKSYMILPPGNPLLTFLNNFIEVELRCNKLHMFGVCRSKF